MLQRQTSFRGFNQQLGGPANKITSSSPFKRQLSLRLTELPSTIERQQSWVGGSGGVSVSGSASGLAGLPITSGLNGSFAQELVDKELGLDAVQEEEGEEDKPVNANTNAGGEFPKTRPYPLSWFANLENSSFFPAVSVIPVTVLKSQLSHLYQMSEHQNREGKKEIKGPLYLCAKVELFSRILPLQICYMPLHICEF